MRILYGCLPLAGHLDWGGVLDTLRRLSSSGHRVAVASGEMLKEAVLGHGFEFVDLELPLFRSPRSGEKIRDVLSSHIEENFCHPESNIRAAELLLRAHDEERVDLVFIDPFSPAPLIFARMASLPVAGVWLEKRRLPEWYRRQWERRSGHLRERIEREFGLRLPVTRQVRGDLSVAFTIREACTLEDCEGVEFVGGDPLPGGGPGGGDAPIVYFSSGTLFWTPELLGTMKEVAVARPDVHFVFSRGYGAWEDPGWSLPNLEVVHSVDENRELQRFDAVITQGGQGTISKCIRAGRPAIAVPAFFGNLPPSRWLERLGMGHMLPSPMKAGEFVAMLDGLLGSNGVRQKAMEARDKFAAAGGSRRAAELLLGHCEKR